VAERGRKIKTGKKVGSEYKYKEKKKKNGLYVVQACLASGSFTPLRQNKKQTHCRHTTLKVKGVVGAIKSETYWLRPLVPSAKFGSVAVVYFFITVNCKISAFLILCSFNMETSSAAVSLAWIFPSSGKM